MYCITTSTRTLKLPFVKGNGRRLNKTRPGVRLDRDPAMQKGLAGPHSIDTELRLRNLQFKVAHKYESASIS